MQICIATVKVLIAICLIGFAGCGSDDDPVTPTKDTKAPAAITDVACIDRSDVSATLQWTATGDDDNSGTAKSYQIRFSMAMIDAANWSSATLATGAPTPKTAGSTETHEVTGLAPMTRYYFALKAADETPNWSGVSNSPDTTTDLPALLQITTHPAVDHSPAYSADGTMLAFVSERGGFGQEIWILPATGGAAIQITSFSNASASYYSQSPSWSPTGDSLVFHSNNMGTYDIWVVDVSAGAPYQPYRITSLATDEQFPEWSHDGTMIAFCDDCDAANSDIYYVSPAGGSRTQVTTDGLANRSPTWSPNDDNIAFNSFRDGNVSIYSIQLSSGLISRVSFERDEETNPSWSPDGNFIAYMQNSSEGPPSRWNVSYVSITSGVSHTVTDTNDGLHQNFPWWSPDGKRIAYTHWSSTEVNIYSVRIQ